MKYLKSYLIVGILSFLAIVGIIIISCKGGGEGGTGPGAGFVVKTGVTGDDGVASFVDKESKETFTVQVVDAITRRGIAGANITYYDGEDLEGFAASAASYIPELMLIDAIPAGKSAAFSNNLESQERKNIGNFVNNSPFQNKLNPIRNEASTLGQVVIALTSEISSAKGYIIENITDPAQQARIQDFAFKSLLVNCTDPTSYYQGTVNREGFRSLILFEKAVVFWVIREQNLIKYARWSNANINDLLNSFKNDIPASTYFDFYKMNDESIQYAGIFETTNRPVVTIDSVEVKADRVTVKWTGTDETTYQPSGIQDATICLDGNEKSNLEYYYRLTQEGGTVLIQDWTKVEGTKVDIKGLAEGVYEVQVKAIDEARNQATSDMHSFYYGTGPTPTPTPFKRTKLMWKCEDPDPGDELTFDVYFEPNDETPDVLVVSNLKKREWDPGAMEWGTTYYWQVFARDSAGNVVGGAVWHFTTMGSSGSTGIVYQYNPEKVDKKEVKFEKLQSSTWRRFIDFYKRLLPGGGLERYKLVDISKTDARMIDSLLPDQSKIKDKAEISKSRDSKSPYTWDKSFIDADAASVRFTAVDIHSLVYENPPDPPHDPVPADGATDVWPNRIGKSATEPLIISTDQGNYINKIKIQDTEKIK